MGSCVHIYGQWGQHTCITMKQAGKHKARETAAGNERGRHRENKAKVSTRMRTRCHRTMVTVTSGKEKRRS